MLFPAEQNLTVKTVLYLLINKGFSKCEIWKESDWIRVHHGTKKWRSHGIASKKMDMLQDIGFSSKDAQRMVIMEGDQKLTKTNLSLLGQPLVIGNIEELSNHTELWDNLVTGIEINGFRRNKLIIKIN